MSLFLRVSGIALLAMSSVATAEESSSAVGSDVFDSLQGAVWTGSLTYVDYTSGKRTEIRAELEVVSIGDGVYDFRFSYPDEPGANSRERMRVRDNGKKLNGRRVASVVRSNDVLVIVAESSGIDDGKPTTFRHTYTIGEEELSIRKDVLPEGQEEWFERNTYSFRRAKEPV